MRTAARRQVLLIVLLACVAGLVPSGREALADVARATDRESGAATPWLDAVPDTVPDTLPEANVFLPEDRDLSDCLSSLPKPDCGNRNEGGPAQLLTFIVLMLGMAFIGWRIFRSVRRRDRDQTPAP